MSTFVKMEREELELRLRELEHVERAIEALDHPRCDGDMRCPKCDPESWPDI
jgi:hypothetical protein